MSSESHKRGRPRTPVGPRFWSKVDVEDANECWEWISALDGHGYGTFWFGGGSRQAHQIALLLSDDTIESLDDIPGEVVRHTCDNPACVNPAHLDPGTQSDNLKDHVRRTRDDRLTDAQVREIRERAAAGETYADLAEEFDRHRTNIGSIVRRETYEWVE